MAGWLGLLAWLLAGPAPAAEGEATLHGEADSDHASILIQGHFPTTRPGDKKPPLIVATRWIDRIHVGPESLTQKGELGVTVLQGKMEEVTFRLEGQATLLDVTGEGLLAWGIRQDTNQQRQLVLRTDAGAVSRTNWTFHLTTHLALTNGSVVVHPLQLAPPAPSLYNGFIRIDTASQWEVAARRQEGLTPIDPSFFPGETQDNKLVPEPLTFRFSGSEYDLVLAIEEADPDRRRIRLEDFRLAGDLDGSAASFVLTGQAVVRDPKGGSLRVLDGPVAMTDFTDQEKVELVLEGTAYHLHFRTNGVFPVRLAFDARIREDQGWKSIQFTPASSALRPVTLRGLPPATTLRLEDAAQPKPADEGFASHLPAAGPFKLRWQEARPEVEGKLFFAVKGSSQIAVQPGLVQQTSLLDYRVMQGELELIQIALHGPGQITRIEGEGILGWEVQPEGDHRRLVIRLNQPRKDGLRIAIHTQSPLEAFPLQFQPLRLVPEGAIRYGGHLRVVNVGAVRLEVLEAPGLAQISPSQFPATEGLRLPQETQEVQVFAFRFSGPAFQLSVQADHVLPELAISQVLVHHLGETETTIDAELEMEIREAPLREFEMKVPAGYSVALLNAAHLSDYNLVELQDEEAARLTLQFTQPLLGRAVVRLRLARSHDSPPETWSPEPLQLEAAKSVRGFVGFSADPGLRLIEAQTEGLTEIAPAFFPRKLGELQLAFRLRDPVWSATIQSERLALSIQVDSLHLFSIGEGLVYGSALFNYLVSGAPVSVLKFSVPTNYANLEFVGRDVRNWQQTGTGYEVHLHSPVSGTYSLLATFDRQFDPQGEELAFDGLQPLEVQSEQGHVVLVSTYQFQTDPVEVSAGLIPLQPGEVPTEYRLLFDAPILRSYQFSSRPFELRLNLTSLSQGETVNQVIDRATFNTHVSGEGQVLTDATYLVKSKGNSHLRISVPGDASLWSVMVQQKEVVPVNDGESMLVPLPQDLPADEVIPVSLKLALKSARPTRVSVSLPRVDAPILLGNWTVQPDEGYALKLLDGTVRPHSSPEDGSGFAWLSGKQGRVAGWRPGTLVGLAVVSLLIGALVWQGTMGEGAHRFDLRNTVGVVLGLAGIGLGICMLGFLAPKASDPPAAASSSLVFSMPVQAPGEGAEIQLLNRETEDAGRGWFLAWPAYLGLLAWAWFLVAHRGFARLLGIALGWVLVAWGCLRLPSGAGLFLWVLILFTVLHILWPLLLRQFRMPKKPRPPAAPAETPATGNATTCLLLLPFLWTGTLMAAPKAEPVTVGSVLQKAEVRQGQAFVQARVRWEAREGQVLDFLRSPAVLTDITYPTNQLKLVEAIHGDTTLYRLIVLEPGPVELAFEYQVGVTSSDGTHGFPLVAHHGLINRLSLKVDRAAIELVCPQAVSIQRGDMTETTSRFDLTLMPVSEGRVGWKPLSRDVASETTLFYAELFELLTPAAGIVEGLHSVQVRPAQGRVGEMTFRTPTNLTITDVRAEALAEWRFDPDQRTLRIRLEPGPSQPFVVQLMSQITTGPLPFEETVGLLEVENAAGQVGMLGIATGNDVQLDEVVPSGLSSINLEDFPADLVVRRTNEIGGLTLRRAYRSTAPEGGVFLKVSAVEPDVRVSARQTLSLGEDRSLLAVNLEANITRAGIFKLSFVLPRAMDVESITGEALSHWTEVSTGDERIVTLHLKGKTTGQQAFDLSLVGPGVPAATGWAVPRLRMREADKQTGLLLVVPEQGMRLQVDERDGLTQQDPKEVGIRQKGVLAFRLLEGDWRLSFDIEKVDPWIQVLTLLDITFQEGQAKATATLEYTIENAGLKSLFLQLPADADGVRFVGEQIADALKSETPAGATVEWEVKLRRRWIGKYTLQVHYQLPIAPAAASETIVGVQARQVNLERGYLTLRTSGRLQVNIPRIPPALQAVDWRSLPGSLRNNPNHGEGNFTFRIVDPAYRLTLDMVRHEAEQLLPARILKSELRSLLSDSGEMLTQVRLTLQPGNKRLLQLELPRDARFWFAFVNQGGVWPWEEEEKILIPLEANFKPGESAIVDFFYTVATQGSGRGGDEFTLVAPQIDLPLEDITWEVYLPEGRRLEDFVGGLQLQEKREESGPQPLDLQSYLQRESIQQKEQTREAESMLALANDYLSKGRQQEARKAFQSAWRLSQHDDAFNEDARVQLHNLKMQQALVGLNYRRNAVFQDQVDTAAANTNAALNILQANRPPTFTQQQVQQALELNPVEENSALMTLAEELIEQQDASQVAPESIRATLPRKGHQLLFTRSLLVDPSAELRLDLETRLAGRPSWTGRFMTLAGLFISLTVFLLLTRRDQNALNTL